jgi:hypothetical protein
MIDTKTLMHSESCRQEKKTDVPKTDHLLSPGIMFYFVFYFDQTKYY